MRLHLVYGDANDTLVNANFIADAWFLDGFSPAKNPELWNRDLLLAIGNCHIVVKFICFLPVHGTRNDREAIVIIHVYIHIYHNKVITVLLSIIKYT